MTAPLLDDPTAAPASELVELCIGGMTCAACAGRVERALNKLDGVSASVNYATERAIVAGLPAPRTREALAAVRRAGYDAAVRVDDDERSRRAAADRIRSLLRRLFVAALLAFPLMDLTLVLALVPRLRFPGWEALCILLAVPVVTWCAWPFHRAALRNVRHGMVSMDTLVSLGILVSFGWAVATAAAGTDAGGYWLGYGATPAGASAIYLDVAAGMTAFQLAGRYFETRSRRKAGDILHALAALAPTSARTLRDGAEIMVPVTALSVGDRIVVRAGETIPIDGTVETGLTSLDTAAITGEPLPREVGPGDAVVAGCISRDGRLVLAATAVGAHTQLAQMTAMAEQAQASKARVQALVDKIVRVFVPSVIVLAVLVTAGWLLAGATVSHALSTGISVLIIACPCALGLATPTALMVGVGRGAQLGILIKGQAALEASGRIDTIVLDKTGTLTSDELRVATTVIAPGGDEVEALALAASVEAGTTHPVASALTAAAVARVSDLPAATGHRTLPGRGAEAEIGGCLVAVGSRGLLEDRSLAVPDWAESTVREATDDGMTPVFLLIDADVRAVFTIADAPRPSAGNAVRRLSELGLHTILLTGDGAPAARRIAAELGIDDIRSEVMPTQKAATITALKADGHRVAMVGDGINDAAALGTADLSMAVVTGTDIALRSADIILVRDDLSAIADAIVLARRTLHTIRGNLIWAFVYNIAALPISAAGLLNPLISAAAMSLSSVLVVWNSLRLRNAVSGGRPRSSSL